MLKTANNLAGYSLAAGEPFILSVQLRDDKNAVLDHSNRKLVLSFYDGDRKAVEQIQGVVASDASGAFFRFVRDGRFSDNLFGKSLQVELAEQLLEGRDILASGPLTIDRSSGSVASFGSLIGRSEVRAMIYFDDMNVVRSMEISRLRYAGAAVPSAPSVQTPAAINSDGTPQVGEQLMGVDPVFRFASITRRRWLRGSTALATTNAYTPDQIGSITWSVDGLGEDGSAIKSESTIVVAEATPTLTISGPLTFTAGTAAGTLVANIGNVPAGATPTLTPNDGRLAIAGSAANGWKVVVGLSASSAGEIAVAVAAAGANGASATVTVTAPTTGRILPTAALNDVAVGNSGYASPFLNLGTITIPAGDFVMAVGTRLPKSNAYPLPIIAMAPAGAAKGYLHSASNLLLAYIPSTGDKAANPARGSFILSGRDDANRWLTPQTNRSIPTYWPDNGAWGTNVQYMSGPFQDTPDGQDCLVVIQKKDGVVGLWFVEPGCTAVLHDFTDSSFGTMTAADCCLGRFPGQGIRQVGAAFQRFFIAAGSLTPAQMEAIAQGVDPRQYLAFDQPTDRLTNIQNTGTAPQPDLVGSGSVTITGAGSYTAVADIIPRNTVIAEMPRVFMERNRVVQRSAPTPTSAMYLDGRVTGLDDDIYVQVVEFAAKGTVVVPFTRVARSVNGEWSGSLPGVPSTFKYYDIQIRKGLDGTVYTLNKSFEYGHISDGIGQSIYEELRTASNVNVLGSSVAAGHVSIFSRAKSNAGSTQGNSWRGWKRDNSGGYGEMQLARLLAELLQCPIGIVNSAVKGSGIDAWQKGSKSGYEPMVDTWRRTRPASLAFSQGQGSLDVLPADYKAFLDKMLADLRADLPWDWSLIMEPLNANGDLAASGAVFERLRVAQAEWADANASKRVFNAGNFNDCAMYDKIHPTLDAKGQGRIAERLARTIAFAEGVVSTSAKGPVITGGSRNGAVVRVNVAHNGGAALRTPYSGNVTGFEVSTDNFATRLAIASVAISGPASIDITLSAGDPGMPVQIVYQRQNPGPGTSPIDANGFIPAVGNPLYDDRSPGLNTGLGFPVMFTYAPVAIA